VETEGVMVEKEIAGEGRKEVSGRHGEVHGGGATWLSWGVVEVFG